ncbi:hypothetical protein MAPG_00429 [Magnaporthiopsis poae ATCC 64411]|uniref:Nucleoporin Nup159/Nup146 N-terminal domain-containing protein n=1 Tax=Magnaporthiopsis poae (strain ATCC 64411 / 73-15) TaxID=644358 RepID=A0A0C4DKZ7_MAGP6|nr:hypothetical protein MAPG_00429 [Magnaporthiopsis poae ATCC 64411]
MAFGGFAGGSSAAGAAGQVSELELIQTESLGFLTIAGDAKLQLTPKWTDLPAPTASLISIAPKKGLVAAAGPDAVHIATTESVRKGFEAPKPDDSDVRPFEPQAKLPLPVRISQLAFTADEQYLVMSAETGGGLAVYDVQSLSQGSTQPAMEISTSGETLRALVPNPMPELAELVIAVTNNGNLLIANLKQRGLVSGPNGPVLRSGVSCAAWSTKGKQLVAGLADGSIAQIKPDGAHQADIPKPPTLGDFHVASLVWLENHVFMAVHNATSGDPTSAYHVITRHQEKGAAPTFTFQKLTDPVEPYAFDKKPHHTIARLKDFPPNLQDVLIVSSTSREAIGLLTRSKAPLTSDVPAEKITNVFTTTEFADDTKRAQLPMGEDFMDTFPIGTALDLSSKDKVYKPIPTDEIEESPGPLPALWALNNEGVLAVWWIVYNDSIREGSTYPGIAIAQGAAPPAASVTSPTRPGGFGSPAAASPARSGFGSPAPVAPAFGGASALGAKTSPWGASSTSAPSTGTAFGSTAFGGNTSGGSGPTFGAPAFGSPSAIGGQTTSAFGQTSSLGGMGAAKASPWATASSSTAGAAFGQPAFGSSAGSAGANKVFGSGTSTPASGGFSAFASKGGFGALGGGASSGGSIFASSKPSGSFAPPSQDTAMDQTTSFPPPAAKPAAGAGGSGGSTFGSTPFVLGTTFKADPQTAHDNETPSTGSGGGGSLFGAGFGLSLGDAAKAAPAAAASPESKEASMETEKPEPAEQKPTSIFGATTGAPAQQKPAGLFGSAPSTSTEQKPTGLFGSTLTSSAEQKPAGLFGSAPSASTEQKPTGLFGSALGASSEQKPAGLFGSSPSAPTEQKPAGLFGSASIASTEQKPTSIFGSKPSAPKSIFGAPTGSGTSNEQANTVAKQTSTLGSDSESKAAASPGEGDKPNPFAPKSSTPNDKPNPFANISAPDSKPNPFASSPAPDSKPNPFANISAPDGKPNPFAKSSAPNDKPNPFAPKDSALGSTSGTSGTTTSVFGSKSDMTPPATKPGLFGASTTPTTTPAPSKLFGGTSSAGLFGGATKPTGSGSIFGAPSQTPAKKSPEIKDESDSTPLPPDTTKTRRQPSPESTTVPEEAPLPPDPIKEKSKYKLDDIPLPPGVLPPKPLPAPTSLPKLPKEEDVPEQPIPSSPEDDEGELSEVDEDEDEGGSGDDEDQGSAGESEGSGVDVAKDVSPTVTTGIPGFTPQSSFGGIGGSVFSLTPAAEPPPGTRRLFGDINAPVFSQPLATSPRSPSPVRGVVPPRVFRSESRSVSAPGMASQILGASRQPSTRGLSATSRSTAAAPSRRVTPDPNVEEQRKAQARKAAEESQTLSDQDDDWLQEYLNEPLVPTLHLAEFVTNAGSVPEAGRTVAEQNEVVFRDINRMVDTLGLNARHLKEYILGHMGKLREPSGAPRKSRHDLEFHDDWLLCDAEDVDHILTQELRDELEAGRVRDLEDTMEACKELSRGLARLRIKEMDLKKNIAARLDPEQTSALRSLPLSAEQAAQQADLRKQFTAFSKLLVEAEESLTLLRARMATAGAGLGTGPGGRKNLAGAGGAGNNHATAAPTVEQVMRTVMKMTSMVEKRSGDVDVLENQLRKLRLQGSVGPGSRDNSPFTTPQKRMSRSIFSPGALASSVVSYNGSPGTLGSTPRKKLSGYTEPEKAQIRARLQKRGAAIARLRDSVQRAGPNVWHMTDDD